MFIVAKGYYLERKTRNHLISLLAQVNLKNLFNL